VGFFLVVDIRTAKEKRPSGVSDEVVDFRPGLPCETMAQRKVPLGQLRSARGFFLEHNSGRATSSEEVDKSLYFWTPFLSRGVRGKVHRVSIENKYRYLGRGWIIRALE
jgi:hypothetical protein